MTWIYLENHKAIISREALNEDKLVCSVPYDLFNSADPDGHFGIGKDTLRDRLVGALEKERQKK